MLTKAEKHGVLKCLHLCSLVLPVQVDTCKQEVRVSVSRWKKIFCGVYYALFLLHAVLKTLRVVHVVLFEAETPMHHLMIHMTLVAGGAISSFWYYVMFIRYPDVHTALVTISLCKGATSTEENGTARAQEAENRTQLGGARWRAYTLQDILAIYAPHAVAVLVVLICAAEFYFPKMPLLLYSGLPPALQSPVIYVLLCIEEARYMITLYCVAIPTFQLQVIMFSDISNRLQDLAHSKTESWVRRIIDAKKAVQALKYEQLHLVLVNLVLRYMIFSLKIGALTACIINGYAAIAHFNDHIIFGLMYWNLFTEMLLIYGILYDRAFAVPELFESAARRIFLMLTMCRRPVSVERKALERTVKGIPKAGIKVGDFHTLERTSTPVFIDFVLTNVVNMLVAYN